MTPPTSDGYLFSRDFENGVRAGILITLYGAQINVGKISNWDEGFSSAYCYDSVADAVVTLSEWDGTGEPQGWFRNPCDGRRRPGGDASQEFIRP